MKYKEKFKQIKLMLDEVNISVGMGNIPKIKYEAFLKTLKFHIPTNFTIRKKENLNEKENLYI